MTKPTNEERRRIAENIRGAAETAEFGRCVYLEGTLFGMGVYARSIESMRCGLYELADLIEPEPERTCRIKYAYAEGSALPHAACSECGGGLSYYDTVDERGEESMDPCPYCPFCGAKVVDE